MQGPRHESAQTGCFLNEKEIEVEGVIGEVGKCRLNLNSHGVELGLVRNICKSHAAGTVSCSVVSVDSALLSPSLLALYLAGCGLEAGKGFGRGGIGLHVLAGSSLALYETMAHIFL